MERGRHINSSIIYKVNMLTLKRIDCIYFLYLFFVIKMYFFIIFFLLSNIMTVQSVILFHPTTQALLLYREAQLRLLAPALH